MARLTRPTDSWVAYCFDGAVLTFGRWCDGKLAETDRDGKPVRTLADLLADPQPKPARQAPQGTGWAQSRRYRDPREMVKVFG